jgi:hypothetical protein
LLCPTGGYGFRPQPFQSLQGRLILCIHIRHLAAEPKPYPDESRYRLAIIEVPHCLEMFGL